MLHCTYLYERSNDTKRNCPSSLNGNLCLCALSAHRGLWVCVCENDGDSLSAHEVITGNMKVKEALKMDML